MKNYGFNLEENEKIIGVAKVISKNQELLGKWIIYNIIKSEVKLGRINKAYLTKVNNRLYDYEQVKNYLKRKNYNCYAKKINNNKYVTCYVKRVA